MLSYLSKLNNRIVNQAHNTIFYLIVEEEEKRKIEQKEEEKGRRKGEPRKECTKCKLKKENSMTYMVRSFTKKRNRKAIKQQR